MVEHLPPESAVMTALRNTAPDGDLEKRAAGSDPASGRWSQSDMLLAQLIDAVRQLSHCYVVANTDSKARKKVTPPEPVARPGIPRTGQAPARGRMSGAAAEALWQIMRGTTPAPAQPT
ncbi:hypothetical protein [Streptomyces syringium]|uniref:hypothetical protein n=1 Tax=Streptomyces syringium TaxID=76729 RepID=UPI0033FD8952